MSDSDENKLIRAADYMLSPEEMRRQEEQISASEDPFAALLLPDDRDTVLYGIFGDIPDYTNPEMEAIWDEVLEAEPEDVYEYCFKKGVDLFQDDGKPVPPWRDIAVMLKAIDKGILHLVK